MHLFPPQNSRETSSPRIIRKISRFWNIRKISSFPKGCPRDVRGMSAGCPRDVRGMSMRRPRDVYETSAGRVSARPRAAYSRAVHLGYARVTLCRAAADLTNESHATPRAADVRRMSAGRVPRVCVPRLRV